MHVHVSHRAQHDIEQLDPQVARRITDGLRRFAETGQGEVTRLQGRTPPEWRLRVGDWRIIFSQWTPASLVVIRVLHRREAYR